MDRGEFLRRAGGIALGAFTLPFATSFTPWTPTVDRPNVVLIVSDDQPHQTANDQDMLKAYEVLAAQGLVFEEAYVAVPRCGPSRAAMLMGKYPARTDIVVNEHASKRFRHFDHHKDCFPYYLATEAGYRCGLVGKWLNDYDETPGFVSPGFQRWFSTWPHATDPVKVNTDGMVRRTDFGQRAETGKLSDKVLLFMEEAYADQVPFLCIAAYNAPHHPANPSMANKGTYSGVPLPRPPNFDHPDPNKPHDIAKLPPLTNDQIDNIKDTWRGRLEEVQDIDDGIEKICAGVNFDNTYVFFLSDNGFHHGEHRIDRGKATPYEESTKTHLWVRGPAVVVGQTTSDLVSNVDIAPTLYELAGLDHRVAETDGRSLLPAMVGAENYERREALLIDLPPDPDPRKPLEGWQAIRTPDALYVEHDAGERELYDMVNDPFQLANAYADHLDEAAVLSEQLTEMKGASGDDLRRLEAPEAV